MSDGQVVIAIDAMCGENSPYKVLKGVEIFQQNEKNTKIIFFGDELLIYQNISKYNLNIFNFEVCINYKYVISLYYIILSDLRTLQINTTCAFSLWVGLKEFFHSLSEGLYNNPNDCMNHPK